MLPRAGVDVGTPQPSTGRSTAGLCPPGWLGDLSPPRRSGGSSPPGQTGGSSPPGQSKDQKSPHQWQVKDYWACGCLCFVLLLSVGLFVVFTGNQESPHQQQALDEDHWACSCLCLVFLLSVVLFIVFGEMGQAGRKGPVTLLNLVLQHFKDFQGKAIQSGDKVYPGKLKTLCQLEWSTFSTGWPLEGTFSLAQIYSTQSEVFDLHRDQILYIVALQYLIEEPPSWLKAHLPLANETISLRLRQARSPKPEQKDEGEPGKKTILPPLDVEVVEFLPSPYMSPKPDSWSQDTLTSPPHMGSGSTYGTTKQKDRPDPSFCPSPPLPPFTSPMLPLHEVVPPDGRGHLHLTYSPFSSSDIYNWKAQHKFFSVHPQDLINLLETVFLTHQHTWVDIQQLLMALFNTEERDHII
ncbi:uncharacterized protein LOC116570493 [Mustela erminea]|uniref:uncharacterized protein LOC116570493 n=1 Tax=Mustela erminea TaxID=36723 RepID=UPI001386C1AF|nr:uncharacterized protein LOC116570493 [Mustela erminea]XP_032163573.1 uncharacterized protein LOC116570493 [Mustela erminea]XP_032163574.1 uncharacterized protein LOC116570493 [Mustela erminea]XP_032163575.1 uncharacterized protein LOC116570493 [Mustela erminea]